MDDLSANRSTERDLVHVPPALPLDARNEPLNPTKRLNAAPRCGARSKRTGMPCRAPAVGGKQRCRMHGGAHGSGGRHGNTNAYKHGLYSADARALGFIGSWLAKAATGDRRHAPARLVRAPEIRALVNRMWALGAGDSQTERLTPLRLAAIELAQLAGVEWRPPREPSDDA